MKGSATSPGKKTDLHDKCRWLRLTAENEHDEIFLAKLYVTVFHGGTISFKPPKAVKKTKGINP